MIPIIGKHLLDKIIYLSCDEKNEIKKFFKKLGRTNVENEKNEIENMTKFLEEKICELKMFGLKKSKLKFQIINRDNT